MKFTLTGVVVFQIVTIFGARKTLWSASRDRRQLVRRIGVSLALDVTLALILLLAAPGFMNTPLSFFRYFAPDIFWLTTAVVIIPLGRDILKGLVVLHILRATRSVRPSFSAA